MKNKLMTIQEVAGVIKMHSETVRRYVRERRIPATKIGKRWLIKDSDVDFFIKKSALMHIN
jgi:excisionase family DNA binding protein